MTRPRADAKRAAPNGAGPDPTPPAATLEDVPLDQIYLTFDTQARVVINEHIVHEYAEAMTEGAHFPPVVLFRDAEGYWIGDGNHRCRAAKQVGDTTIKAEVREGGWREAFLYACSANTTHGLRRDKLDIRGIVWRLLTDEEWGQWSDREIARRCAVSHPYVGKLRAEIEKRRAERDERLTGNVSSERTYTTKHGTVATMDTSRIGAPDAIPGPTNGAPPAARRTSRRQAPAPLSTEGQKRRDWYYFTAGLQQVLLDFGREGGIQPLLKIWTAEERARAKAQLAEHREQLDRLDAAIAALDTPEREEDPA